MASSTVFAARYANAFASVATTTGLDASAAQQQMRDFADTLAGSHELREVMMNPSIPAEQKLAVLDGLAERIGMFREVRNFFAVIMDHQRLGELHEILTEYDRVTDASTGIEEVGVSSAHELNEEDRAELEAQITKLAGGRVRVMYQVDPALLGGAVVTIASKVYDGSLRSQLEQMKQVLVSA